MVNVEWIMRVSSISAVRRSWGARFSLYIIHCALSIFLTGCYTSRTNDYLLYTNSIRGNRVVASEELEGLIPQKPNRRILRTPITPALWFYQAASRGYNRDSAINELAAKTTEFERKSEMLGDESKALKKLNRQFNREARKLRRYAEEGNWVMRNVGEKPVYFLPLDAQANAAKLQQYLRRTKGFFRATVAYSVDTLIDGRVRVNYLVNEETPYVFQSITYDIADPAIQTLVESKNADTFLHVGDRFDGGNVESERTRIEELLRNNGYYEFSRDYIRPRSVQDITTPLPADTLSRPIDFTIRILNPPRQSAHPVYQIGDVKVTIAPSPVQNGTNLTIIPTDTSVTNGITYFYSGRRYAPRLLDSKIRLRPNELYSISNYNLTQRQLFLLNQFKFVNINFIDTTARRLRTEIRAIPLEKYEVTTEGGLFVLYQGQGYPGPFGNVSFRVRNLFGGLETFETNLRAGIEAQTGFSGLQTGTTDSSATQNKFYYATEIGLTTSLIFPQILFPGRIRFTFNDLNPKTQISLGYNYTNRPDFLRQTFRSTMSYNWQKLPKNQYSFFLADINLIRSSFNGGKNPALRQQFEQLLKANLDSTGNRTLYNSFLPSFASNMSFAYTYNTNVFGQNRRANFFRVALESGGTTLNFLRNKTVEQLIESSGLQFFKYLRFNADYRHYIPLRPRTTLAFRVNTGLRQ
ncbi:MAG: outer membrane protein assembly factor, partial [Rudanella sp.]|nr:outer membrane protein assembly factor [Rudanella sp.]